MNKKILLSLAALLSIGLTSCGEVCEPCSSISEPTSEAPAEGEAVWTTFEDEEGNVYTGFAIDGVPNGYGTMEYMSSTVYKGEWEDGEWNGSCNITWDSGCIYIGEAKDNLMHGIGYMLWPMGDYYYGDWKYGQPEGFGTKYYMVNAYGESEIKQYNIYVGDISSNLKNGKGIMRYNFGAIYDGEWFNDVRSGHGVQYWEDDEAIEFIKFVGEFSNDWIAGEGTMYYRDGRIVHGIWSGTTLTQELD